MDTLAPGLLERFAAIVGPNHALAGDADIAGYLTDPRERYQAKAAMVLRPRTVEEVAAIVRLAAETRTGIVPQGGNTGLVGGQLPDDSGSQILLSLGRLNRIRALDPAGNTITLEAGVVLADAQQAADEADRLLAMTLASEGSCQIGGTISTNAGGTAVLAYGNTRDQVLGLEVVLASGQVWNGLRTLRKDNTGYDLKQLFIGAEGTLGIVTAAVLRLFPKPKGKTVALVGLTDPDAALKLFNRARAAAGTSLTAAELMPRIAIEFVTRHLPGARDPLAAPHRWYLLMETSSGHSEAEARTMAETILADALQAGEIEDAVLADSLEQAAALWQMRHILSDIQKPEGASIKHDVSIAVADVPAFIAAVSQALLDHMPGIRPFPFGHLGDGNIHFNVSQPVGADAAAFLAETEAINDIVHGLVARFGGSISAEHGIGRTKRAMLPGVKSEIEMALMRQVKAMLDPDGILNPGKVL